MKKLLACLFWATCLPNLAYPQINPKDLVGIWLLDSLDNRKSDTKGYFILHENSFAEEAMAIYHKPRNAKWYFVNQELIFRDENEPVDNVNFFKILNLDSKNLIIESYKRKAVFKKITQDELNTLKNSPEFKNKLEENEKQWKEDAKQEAKEKRERLLPFCGIWTCKVGRNKITLQLTEDGVFTYQAGKVQASGSWNIEYDVLDINFPTENNDYQVGRQNYRLQIISQTDKELKTKDFLTQTVLVWHR